MKTGMPAVGALFALVLLRLCSAEQAAAGSVVGGGLRGGLFAALRQRQHHAAAPDQDDEVENVAVTSSAPADDDAVAEAAADTLADTASSPPLVEDSVGPDGFPVLPAVSAISGSAAATLKSVSSQANVLEARLAQTQKENEEKLAKQKTIFEDRLKTQEQSSRVVVAENADINRNIGQLREGNANLTNQAKELRSENRLKRTELETLKAKISLASEYVAESLKETNDVGVAALAVLKSSVVTHPHEKIALVATGDKSEKSDDQDDEDDKNGKDDDEDADKEDDSDDDGDKDRAESFLALSSKVRRVSMQQGAELEVDALSDFELEGSHHSAPANPRDLIGALFSGVDTLSKQGDANIAHLKALFVASFKGGSKRHSDLLQHQNALNATRIELQNTKIKLQEAVSHLEATHKNLDERLRGLGNFLRRLGHLGSAPGTEAKRILKTLPSKISPQKAPADVAAADGAVAAADSAASDASSAD